MEEKVGEDARWGPGFDAARLTVPQLRHWRGIVARQLRYWDRVCRRMLLRRWCRVDPTYYRAHEIRDGLQHINEELARLEAKAMRTEEGPPY